MLYVKLGAVALLLICGAVLVGVCVLNPHVAPALDDDTYDTEPLPELTDEQFGIRWQIIAPQWASDTEGGYR